MARWVIDNGIDSQGQFKATLQLLTRRPPAFSPSSGQPLRLDGEEVADAARRLVSSIDESYLAIQGPPGSGKSTVGAEMIVDLVVKSRRVGVTANSHKVIGELLAKVAEAAAHRGVAVRIGQRSTEAPLLR